MIQLRNSMVKEVLSTALGCCGINEREGVATVQHSAVSSELLSGFDGSSADAVCAWLSIEW
jgi:hypothetical protein